MIAVVVLLIINLIIFLYTNEDTKLTTVKDKYRKLREHLKSTGNEEFKMLYKEIPIVAHYRIKYSVGYNTNKGSEIGLCIDGDVNEIFHVLLHELAHCAVEEYSHSKHFWEKYEKLRDEAISIGIYDRILEKKEFCGKHVMDK